MLNLSSELEEGNYFIKVINGNDKFLEMLSYLGIRNGAEIEILGKGYFPNSIIVGVNDNHIQLNDDFMKGIMVEKVKTYKK